MNPTNTIAGEGTKLQRVHFIVGGLPRSFFLIPNVIWIGDTPAMTRYFFLSLAFVLLACSTKSESTTQGSSTKFEQYYVQGEQLYLKNCSNCHQTTGTGLGLVYPPLKSSDYMVENLDDVICLIKNGKKGELTVNGKSYNQAMPGIPSLTDLEVAEIATYIYNSWENERGIIEVQAVSKMLSLCEGDSLSVIR